MKQWKKATCMALCLTMFCGATACGETGMSEEEAKKQAAKTAKQYVNVLSTALDSAKSCKITGSVRVHTKEEYFGDDGETVDGTLTEEETEAGVLELVITEDGANGYALSFFYQQTETEREEGEFEHEFMQAEIIVKDGYIYQRSYEIEDDMTAEEIAAAKGYWTKGQIASSEQAAAMLTMAEQLMNAKEVKEYSAKMWAAAQEVVAQQIFNGEVKDGEVTLSKNFTTDWNATLDFLSGIDGTDTLGETLNKVLVKINPALTAEGLVGLLKAYRNQTVTESLTAIDGALAKYGTSLQGIYDGILNSGVANILFTEVLGVPQQTILQLKAFKLETMKAQFGTLRLGDAVNMVVAMVVGGMDDDVTGDEVFAENDDSAPEENPDEAVDYYGKFVVALEAALQRTLDDLGVSVPDFSGTRVNDFTLSAGLALNKAGDALRALDLGLKADVQMALKGADFVDDVWVEYVFGTLYAQVDVAFSVVELSASVATVTAPPESEVYEGVVFGYLA